MLKSTFWREHSAWVRKLAVRKRRRVHESRVVVHRRREQYAPKLVKYYERIGFKIIRKVGGWVKYGFTRYARLGRERHEDERRRERASGKMVQRFKESDR